MPRKTHIPAPAPKPARSKSSPAPDMTRGPKFQVQPETQLVPADPSINARLAHMIATLVLGAYDKAVASFRVEPNRIGLWVELTDAACALEFICKPDGIKWCVEKLGSVRFDEVLPAIVFEARKRAEGA